MSSARVAAVLGLSVSLLGACASGGGDGTSGQAETGTRPDAATDETEPSSDAAAALTDADDGATIALVVGEERSLRLDSAWAWEPEIDPSVVALTVVDHLVDPGYAEWLVSGVSPGDATLTAQGDPNCGDPAVCPPRTFTLIVEVSG